MQIKAEGGLKRFKLDSFQKECYVDSDSPKEIPPQLLSKGSVNFSNVKWKSKSNSKNVD